MEGVIHWSCISRDGIILTEAGEDYTSDETITQLAKTLMKKKPTPGWEFHKPRRSEYNGLKFHVYDSDIAGEMMVWQFGCVYDKCLSQDQAQSFLEKLVILTEHYRRDSFAWRFGQTLSVQESFAPVLLQRMQEVAYMGRLAMVHNRVDSAKEVMANNIALILERDEKLSDLEKRATKLDELSHQFKKRARRVKRWRQWQNAKYGLAVGTAITAGVAVVTVPPLIALL